MKPPLFVRPLTGDERDALKAGLRSTDAFTLRRCQILLASADHRKPGAIAADLRCASQTVRNAIHAFEERGVAALDEGSHATHTSQAAFDAAGLETLRALAHQSPRTFGHPTSLWTLSLLATESHRQGLIDEPVTGETIRASLARLKVTWKRAKQWITSPDPEYARKKGGATG
jgi:hypothetical protein